jgi:hypothetical protein
VAFETETSPCIRTLLKTFVMDTSSSGKPPSVHTAIKTKAALEAAAEPVAELTDREGADVVGSVTF